MRREIDSRNWAYFLVFSNTSSLLVMKSIDVPVIPHISFREDKYAVKLRRILWPG